MLDVERYTLLSLSEVILMVGIPSLGKIRYYWNAKSFAARGTTIHNAFIRSLYIHINIVFINKIYPRKCNHEKVILKLA